VCVVCVCVWCVCVCVCVVCVCGVCVCVCVCKGHAAAQLVESLRYKAEGRGFYSRWCHWNFLLT